MQEKAAQKGSTSIMQERQHRKMIKKDNINKYHSIGSMQERQHKK
jgi:hypothetical protein